MKSSACPRRRGRTRRFSTEPLSSQAPKRWSKANRHCHWLGAAPPRPSSQPQLLTERGAAGDVSLAEAARSYPACKLLPVSEADDPALRERRIALVREHMQSENELRFDIALGTFDHPRYELIATGEVCDGPEEVSRYYEASRSVFPDQRNENVVVSYGEDVVVAEFDLLGTHLGELKGIAPTG